MALPQHLIHCATLGTARTTPHHTAGDVLLEIVRSHLESKPRLCRFQAAPLSQSPESTQRYLTEDALDYLRIMTRPCYEQVLPEWINCVKQRRLVVAPNNLPEILDMGHTFHHMRVLLLPVIGPQGYWLADHADDHDWHWVRMVQAEQIEQQLASAMDDNIGKPAVPDEKALIRQLTRRSTGLYDNHPAVSVLLYNTDGIWSEALGRAVIAALRMHLRSRTRRDDKLLRGNFKNVAAFMPLQLRKQLLTLLGGRFGEARHEWRDMVYEARGVFDFRVRMRAALERC
ncbi:MAG: hypothetical protein AAF787_16065 [Chloroflexota bacterium]